MADFELRGAVGKRAVLSFDLWMAGRFFDTLRRQPDAPACRAWAARSFGEAGEALLSLEAGFSGRGGGALRVSRRENKLVAGPAPPGSGYSEFKGRRPTHGAKL